MLHLRGIRKSFGATLALDGVDLDVAAGEVHALIGENGAGKSTLMNILSGLLPPDGGTKVLGDTPAHIHQELALCPHLSVAENMLMGIEPSWWGWLDRQRLVARAAQLLEQFGRSEIDPRARTGDLSLAAQQVVEICRALARDARIVLMDEPTSSLQRPDVERLFHLIRQLRDRGIAVIYISHFLEEVREIATRYTVLRDGRSVGTGEIASVTDDELIALMVGGVRPSPPHSPGVSPGDDGRAGRPTVADGTPALLEVENLASPPRLKSATFTLNPGEILGIAGLIGSGRTEMIRAIFGLQPSTGTITARGTIGYLSEDRKGEGLALALSVADNVTMSRFSACARGGWLILSRQMAQTAEVMRTLHIKAPGPGSKVVRLSGGNQQKVALGRLLHQDAGILLLDEPARGIDVGSKADIVRQIRRLAAEGKGVVMVSSYLPEILEVCDRVAVMTRGRLSPARPVSEWTADSIMQVAVGAN